MNIDNKISPLVLLELNEINFDVAKKYVEAYPKRFNAIRQLLSSERIKTKSESDYENIEPWIQWPSIHTGKAFFEHKIHKLGDCIYGESDQIYEILEGNGYKVAAILPINATNNLKRSDLFIPDPWSNVPTDGSYTSRKLHTAIKQAVNNNSSHRLNINTVLVIGVAFLWSLEFRYIFAYLKLFYGILSGRSWYRALFLDYLIHLLHLKFLRKKKYDFSSIFFNAGAHIQHHYFFNSKFLNAGKLKNPEWYIYHDDDPIFDMLLVYESILSNYFSLDDIEFITANGLSQVPYDRVKFYYRLRYHNKFLNKLNINYRAVYPRMSRDFLCEFDSIDDLNTAKKTLSSVINTRSKKRIFSISHDTANRHSFFVTLSFDDEITKEDYFSFGDNILINNFYYDVAFVALKNGMHHSIGDAFFSQGVSKYAPETNKNVGEIFYSIKKYFNVL